jgi:nucleolar protein 56
MTDDSAGWYAGVDTDDPGAVRTAIETGTADAPADWPSRAVESGAFPDREAYYDSLHEATTAAVRQQVRERERADDQQLVHAVRSMDDARRTANELAERVTEWGQSRFGDDGSGIEYARRVTDRDPEDPTEAELVGLAETVVAMDERADSLRATIESTTPAVAPNLAAMAGPVLAARLISLSGGLGSLAKSTSGTVQLLGAESALFAHLQGNAPSPKHGVIYTHEYVRGTHPDERGSAARALAGKLTIAARVDHYSGERRPELQAELDDRIERIRSRGEE